MQYNITITNYRCFPDSEPATFAIRPGFTAFVGVNNSGKSSLLKFLYEFRSLFSELPGDKQATLNALSGKARPFSHQIRDFEEVFCNRNDRGIELTVQCAPDIQDLSTHGAPFPDRFVITIPRLSNTWTGEVYVGNRRLPIAGLSLSWENTCLQQTDTNAYLVDLAPIFDLFRQLGNTFYVGPFRNALNLQSKTPYFDIQIGQPLITMWDQLKTGQILRQRNAALRLTEDLQHIFRYDRLEINASADGSTLQLVIGGGSYDLRDVGAGVSQFITILTNIINRQHAPSYILIDEPELSLHPTLQVQFLETMGAYATHGVLFATHNIGLARRRANQIYALRRVEEGHSTIEPLEATPDLAEFLGEVSFEGYQALGCNKVLFVEGVSDAAAMQQLLRIYGKEHKVLALQLGGRQAINGTKATQLQLADVKRICKDVAVLIDSERPAAGAALEPYRQDFVTLCQQLTIPCKVLDLRALENYFSDTAVKAAMSSAHRALQPFEVLGSVRPSWSKTADNWRIAQNMTRAELASTDLGLFMEQV